MIRLACLLLLLAAPAWGQIRVVAVNGPLADIAKTLAGDAAEVVMPVPDGTDPRAWRPGIAEIAEIQGADLIILNGAGFAAWTERASLPRARTVVATRGLEAEFIERDQAVTHSHGPEGEHSHRGVVPETWLDPALAAGMVGVIAEALARAAPDAANGIAERAEALQADLLGLPLPEVSRTLIAAHPGLDYLAAAVEAPLVTLDWTPGAAPQSEELAALDALLGQEALLLFQSTPHPDALDALAERELPYAIIEHGVAETDGFLARTERNLDALR